MMILRLPSYAVFAILAALCGFAARPRQRLSVFSQLRAGTPPPSQPAVRPSKQHERHQRTGHAQHQALVPCIDASVSASSSR